MVARQESGASAQSAEIDRLAAQNDDIASLQQGNKRLAAAAPDVESQAADRAALPALRQQERELEAADVTSKTQPGTRVADLSSGVFEISKLDRRPAAERQIRPQWPSEPDMASTPGEVLVDFVVGSDGQVYNAVVLHSSNRGFEKSALAAVSQWVFSPGQVAGQPVNTHMQVPIVYQPGAAPFTVPVAQSLVLSP